MLKIILLLFSLVICQFSYCTSDEEIVEEGWRLHSNLKIQIDFEEKSSEFDLSQQHYAMAHVLRTYNKAGTKEDKHYLCLFRFCPVIKQGDRITLGVPIPLTQEIFDDNAHNEQLRGTVTYSEIAFLSGHYDPDRTDKNESNIIDSDFLSIISERHREKVTIAPFALKLSQRRHINPTILQRVLDFRYPDPNKGPIPKCFQGGNYNRIFEAVARTKENLIQFHQAKLILLNNVQTALEKGHRTDAEKLLNHLNFSKIEERNREEKALIEFSDNPKMNSFTCAEQTGLDFLDNARVKNYLRSKINDNNIIGIIINVHCSHTPCCSCATSLASETQERGVFQRIFGNKSIFLLCSCYHWYDRPPFKEGHHPGMLQYNDTKFMYRADGFSLNLSPLSTKEKKAYLKHKIKMSQKRVLKFSINKDNYNPYPVVQLSYDKQNFRFNIKEDDTIINAYITKLLG